MSWPTAMRALDLFLPRLSRRPLISFYGGEPLLAFNLIRRSVEFAEKKRSRLGLKPAYGLTTNGSLLDEKTLDFLDEHAFSVVLSFDGLAQEVYRPPGSFAPTLAAMKELLSRKRLKVEVNGVFTPQTIRLLADSLAWLMREGVSNLRFSLDLLKPWSGPARNRLKSELARLRDLLRTTYLETGRIPLLDYRPSPAKGFLACSGGTRAMAVAPDGTLWGCHLFSDLGRKEKKRPFRRKFCFGPQAVWSRRLEAVSGDILPNYARLSMASYTVEGAPCALCPDVVDCGLCPMVPAIAGAPLGQVPRYICEIQRLRFKSRRLFWEDLEKTRTSESVVSG